MPRTRHLRNGSLSRIPSGTFPIGDPSRHLKWTRSQSSHCTSLKDAKNIESPADVNEVNNVIAAPTYRYIVKQRGHYPITCDYTLHSQLNNSIKRKSSLVERPTKFHFQKKKKNTKHVQFRIRACLLRWMCTATACAINISPVDSFLFYLSHFYSFARNRTFCYWIYSVVIWARRKSMFVCVCVYRNVRWYEAETISNPLYKLLLYVFFLFFFFFLLF